MSTLSKYHCSLDELLDLDADSKLLLVDSAKWYRYDDAGKITNEIRGGSSTRLLSSEAKAAEQSIK